MAATVTAAMVVTEAGEAEMVEMEVTEEMAGVEVVEVEAAVTVEMAAGVTVTGVTEAMVVATSCRSIQNKRGCQQ